MKNKFLILAMGIILSVTAVAETVEGIGKGFGGDIIVDAEINDNKIVAIKVKSESESDFAKPAIETIINEVIEKQTIKVDDVAGATATSKGIKRAISNAAKKSGVTLK